METIFKGHNRHLKKRIIYAVIFTLLLLLIALHPFIFNIYYEYPYFSGFFTLTIFVGGGGIVMTVHALYLADPALRLTPEYLYIEFYRIPWKQISAVRKSPQGILLDGTFPFLATYNPQRPEEGPSIETQMLVRTDPIKADPTKVFEKTYEYWETARERHAAEEGRLQTG